MAQPHDDYTGAAPASFFDERLRRYLPPDLADEVAVDFGDPDALPGRVIEAFVHLAAARYTIATYLPRLLVHQLLEDRLESPWLRWVEGSLLFADLSGSTALAERLAALGREGIELVTAFLNDIFETMIQVVRDYGGDLVAFGGDALLVYFGDERHTRTAARAALALQESLHGYVRSVPSVGEFPMHLHVGVESGRMAFVSAGSAHAQHYSVLGGTVNGVAAAEGHAGPGQVVVGPRAWAALDGYAEGHEVAPGFVRVGAIRAPAHPHAPLPEEAVVTDAPEVAIPRLLDDLDRISPYIPPLLLGRILADPERPQVEADLRPVTALFAQVAGLEAPAEALPPARAAQAVQTYVAAMQEAIEQFGGVVNKLDVADEGIKLVAIFGAPAAYEDHAERAARAALEMQRQIENVKMKIENELNDAGFSIFNFQFSIRQRIGLNLGAVFAGNVGSAIRKEYTVMGDAVNVAARVMSTAAWGEIWCSEAAAQAFAARMSCEERGQIALKGKSTPLALLRLLGERDPADAAEPAGAGPLIGRAGELSWLREQLGAALGGAGRAVRIVGDAGVGKTRLTAELLEEALGRGARVIPAACFSYTAGIPYAAWAEWLKSLCGIAAGDSDTIRERKLAERLADLGPGMDEWLPILGDLARLDVPDNRLTRGLDPQMRQTRRFELLEQLLLRAAAVGPVVALFEDLHWADPVSLDLWRRVAGALDGRPALLVGVHRPTPALEGNADGAQILALKELSAEESGDLVAALAGDAALSEELVRKLVGRAAGNPLFLAELLRAIQAKLQIADLRSQNGQPEQAAIYNLQLAIDELPDSLSGLLLARIDRLDESSRGVLRVASVIGQRIPFGVLHSIQPADQQALLRQLARLEAQEMTVLERARPEPVHTFRHALIQEVAYQSMLYARRRELHGRIGDYLERRHADDLDDYFGLLAHHYGMSDRRDKAIEYLLKAGHAASREFANEEALKYYGQALDRLAGDEHDPHAWEARDALGEVYATIGRYDDALAQHAAILSADGIPPDIARRAHRKRGSVLEKQGQYGAALDALAHAMAIVRSGAPNLSPLAVPLICADIALVRKRRGEYDLAIIACEEGLRALRIDSRSREDDLIEARLHSELGGIYGMRGDYPRAQQHFERSLRAREAVDDLPGVIFSHNNLGYLVQLQSEYAQAIEHYHIAEELARKINLRYMLVFATLNTAYALINLCAYDEAEERCVEALDLARELKNQQNIAQTHNTLGIVYYHQGAYERAHASFEQALQLNQALGSVHQEANALMHIALVLSAQGHFDEASEAAGRSLEQATVLHVQRLKAEALNALAEAALGRGDAAAAAAYAEEATILSEELGSKYDGGIARRLCGQAAAMRGAPFAAEFEASIALFEAIKHRFELARTWAAYGTALLKNGNQIAARAYLKQALDTFVTIGAYGEQQRLTPIVERSV
jgi:class 3 adenylate cyclase/tetratricopeptide (TPR) repeat protein